MNGGCRVVRPVVMLVHMLVMKDSDACVPISFAGSVMQVFGSARSENKQSENEQSTQVEIQTKMASDQTV